MRLRFILSETWTSLTRNVSMIISVMLVTFGDSLAMTGCVLSAQTARTTSAAARGSPAA